MHYDTISNMTFYYLYLTGRVWKTVFLEQDTYIYTAVDGFRTVVAILRRVEEGRKNFGIDFWYSHYYIVGSYGIPDFYKLKVRYYSVIMNIES